MAQDFKLALLTKTELMFLDGSISVSKDYARKLRYGIRRKLLVLNDLEIPLLVKNGFEMGGLGVTAGSNGVTIGGNATVMVDSGFRYIDKVNRPVLSKNQRSCKRPGRDSNPGRRSDSLSSWFET